jgi:ubiquinone biosynthesis protein COQ4
VAKHSLERRNIPGALLAGARWLVNPVSRDGAKQVPRMKLFARGPELLEEVEQMRAHPTGRRILAEKPDLGAALSDARTLGEMPAGSLGRAFHDTMEIPGGVPGYLLASLVYADGFFDSLEVSDDVRYVIERGRFHHDLFHVVTGFGTDLSGEGLLIYFMLGYEVGLSWAAASLTPTGIGPRLFLRPSCGQRRWRALLAESHAHGVAARRVCPPIMVPWEELLPRPLDEVRRELGIVPFREDTSRWLEGSWLGRQAAGGFGAYAREAEQAQLARRIVESGVSCRDLYRMSAEKYERLARLAAEGASPDEIRTAAA